MASAPISLPAAGPIAPPRRSDSLLRRLLRHPLFWGGATLLGTLIVLAVLAPSISGGQPTEIYPSGLNEIGVPHAPDGPGRSGFPLGADTLGRDVWTRLLFGLRLSLIVAVCAMATSTVIGTTIGLLGGFFGGRIDASLTRFTEIIASLPTILLAITLAVVLPDRLPELELFQRLGNPDLSVVRLLLAIGLVTWTGIARAVRGQTLALREREFVEAARALGTSPGRILTRHLLPNVAPTVIVLATLATAHNILLEAGLSYLGLGNPEQASLGGMIAEGQAYFGVAPWLVLAPGAVIVLAVGAFNLLGNAFSETVERGR